MLVSRPPSRNTPPNMTAWAQWVEEKLYKVDKEGTATAQGVYRALSGNNSALTAVGNQYVALEETKEELSKTISSVDGKLTISDHDPTEDDGLEWPEGAIWETRDENDVALRRFIWVQGEWKPYVLGPEFLDDEIIDKDKFTQEVKDEIDTATSNAATAVQEAEEAKGLAEDAIAAAGGAINGSTIEYAVGSSETVAPTTGWSTTTPVRTPGTFIWMRTIVSYGNGSSETSSPVLLTGNAGADGQQGQDGAPGVSVNSIVSYYQLNANKPAQPTTASPSGWSTDEPQPDFTKKLWRADKVTYSNGSFSWTSVVQVSAYTAANIAMTAADGKSTITYGTTKPSNPKSGDRFYNSANGKTEIYSGSAWRDATPGEGFIPALDIGRGTAGEMEVGRLKAVNTTFQTSVIDKLVSDEAFIRDLYANRIVVAGDNLEPDPYFDKQPIWNTSATFEMTNEFAYPGHTWSQKAKQVRAGASNRSMYSCVRRGPYVDTLQPVEAGKQYTARAWWYADSRLPAGGAGYATQVYFYDANGTLMSNGNLRAGTAIAPGSEPVKTWFETGGEVTAPAGAVVATVRPTIYQNANGSPNNAKVYLGKVEMKRMVGATLIEPGAVTTEKVAANAITANEMAVGTITAASGIIADAAITNAKIANLAVTGAKIANATIGDAKIINLNAAKITAGTLDAARIGAKTITADKLSATALNAKTIAGSILTIGGGAIPKLVLGPRSGGFPIGDRFGLYLNTPNNDATGSLSLEVSPVGPSMLFYDNAGTKVLDVSGKEANIMAGTLQTSTAIRGSRAIAAVTDVKVGNIVDSGFVLMDDTGVEIARLQSGHGTTIGNPFLQLYWYDNKKFLGGIQELENGISSLALYAKDESSRVVIRSDKGMGIYNPNAGSIQSLSGVITVNLACFGGYNISGIHGRGHDIVMPYAPPPGWRYSLKSLTLSGGMGWSEQTSRGNSKTVRVDCLCLNGATYVRSLEWVLLRDN